MVVRTLGLAGALALAVASPLGSAFAQTAEPSMGCRLFPLACPGPVPAPPPPLMGTPEEQAAAAQPAPPPPRHAKHAKAAHHRKHAAAAQ